MTDKRISPLQWLGTKFASLNHSHNEYLTSHQDISGKEDKSNKVTSWSATTTDIHYPSEKLVKESIDSVLYETEELELGTPTTSSNVTYTYTRPYAEQPTSFTISTLNTIDLPSLPVGFRYGDYDYVVDITLPTNENSIFIFGGVYGATVFFDQYNPYQGIVLGGNNIGSISQCNPIGSSLQYRLIFRHIENDKYKVFFNDNDDTYREITIDDDLIEYSSNIIISVSARRINIPLKLSRYIDDIEKFTYLPNGSDLNISLEDIIYLGSNDTNSTISHCPVSNKAFLMKNTPLGEFGSGEIHQQTLITLNDGANTEVWVRSHIDTGGYNGAWVKLATTSDLNSKQDTLISGTNLKTINNQSLLGSGNISIDIEPLKQVATKYFKQENFLNPNCWYDDGDNYTKPTYSNGTLSTTGWGSRFYFKDGYELPNEYTLSFTLSSSGSPTLWVNETSITLGSNPNNISITSNNGNTSVTVNNSTNQTITGKMELLEIKRGQSSSISNFSFNGTYPSNNLWDKKQDTLISGTNLKTINNESLLGSGNISITGGSGTVDSTWITNSTNPVQSQLIKSALDNKEQTSNKVTSISSSSTDNQYPSAKCVYDEVDSLWDNIPNTNDFELVQCKVNDISTYTSDTDMYPSTKAVADYINNVLPANLSDLTDDINCVTTSSASSTTPLSDISGGSSGSSTNYARADHQHQLSDAYARSSHTHSNYVNPTIADNLTTNDSSQVLSAKQGKVLNDMIGQAISYINQ